MYNQIKAIKVGVCMKDNGDINKKIFVKNLNYYMTINNKKQADLVTELGLKTSTVSDWVNGKKYPRVDKMQLLADYFGILKSDLTEEHDTSKLTDDIELQEYLEELKNRSEMRMLFSLAKGATKEDVEKAVKIIEALKEDD
nr:helix-turn-helix transcriptional regulator [uncultured Ruminococcus sp.]